jgi:hypothetical protein
MMKATRRSVSQGIGCAAFGMLALAPVTASAGTMAVNTATMTEALDGQCSLLEAIHALNAKAKFNECNPGTGAVTITLPVNLGPFIIPPAPGALFISEPVTLTSAVANTRATIKLDPNGSTSQAIWVGPSSANTAVTLQDLTIDGTGSLYAVGIFGIGIGGSTLTVNRCEVDWWPGGGIVADSLTLNVTGSSVHENGGSDSATAPLQGGGIYVSDYLDNVPSVFNLSNSTVFGNLASYGGGVFYSGKGHSKIVNSSLFMNHGDYGSAIASMSPSAIIDITASTIAWNVAAVSGAGQGPSIFNLRETILAHNSVSIEELPSPSNWDRNSKIATLTDSLIADTKSFSSDSISGQIVIGKSSGKNLKNTDPTKIVVVDVSYGPPDLGGPTLDNPPMARLPPGSPAIDALTSSTQTTDERGYRRGIGAGYDIGAFEYDPNAQAESMVRVEAPKNGAISNVSNVPNFTPSFNTNPPVGTGIKFTPNAGLTKNASFILRVPLVVGAGDTLRISTQYGPAAGTYDVAVRKPPETTFTFVGTIALYGPSPVQTLFELPIPDSVGPQDYAKMDVQFTLSGKSSRSSNTFLYLDSATFHH